MQRDRKKFSQIPAYSGLCDFVDNRERNIAAAVQSELSKTLEATANAEKFMKVVRKYTSFKELTSTLLWEFVEKIVIHESEALDGKPVRQSAGQGTAKFFTLLLFLYLT